MTRLLKVLVLGFVCASVTSKAKPVDDISGWAQKFTQAALQTDTDAVSDLIGQIADPRINLDVIRANLKTIRTLIDNKKADYAEQFNETNLGTFFKRLNFAVKYPGTILFYSVVLDRSPKGWEIIQFNAGGDVNTILNAQWPK